MSETRLPIFEKLHPLRDFLSDDGCGEAICDLITLAEIEHRYVALVEALESLRKDNRQSSRVRKIDAAIEEAKK